MGVCERAFDSESVCVYRSLHLYVSLNDPEMMSAFFFYETITLRYNRPEHTLLSGLKLCVS